MTPLTLFLSSSVKSIKVPKTDANTPPRSISATNITSASADFAIDILAISVSLKFISAQLPEPSKIMIS